MWKVTVDTEVFDKSIRIDSKIANAFDGSEVHIARKAVELENESVKKALIMTGWTPPASEEQEEPECRNEINIARQCRSCNSAEKIFIDNLRDSPPFEQNCPEGICFCRKKGIKVPAEWDGCEDGFEPVEVNLARHYAKKEESPTQESSESDQDQTCADLAERNRELESECRRLKTERDAINSELESRCAQLGKLSADYVSLKKVVPRRHCEFIIRSLKKKDNDLGLVLDHMREYTLSRVLNASD